MSFHTQISGCCYRSLTGQMDFVDVYISDPTSRIKPVREATKVCSSLTRAQHYPMKS